MKNKSAHSFLCLLLVLGFGLSGCDLDLTQGLYQTPAPTPEPPTVAPAAPENQIRGYFDAYVNYVVADIELGGNSVYEGYKSHNLQSPINSTDAYDQGIHLWDLGIRVCNINEFERKSEGGLTQLVYAGTDKPIETGAVETTNEKPDCLTNAQPTLSWTLSKDIVIEMSN